VRSYSSEPSERVKLNMLKNKVDTAANREAQEVMEVEE